MIHILLVCSAGMSTSMLVRKMNESAKKKGIDAEIWAVGEAEAERHVEHADIILLGPQIRFMRKKIQEIALDTPVSVIDMSDYGSMNGESVLVKAIEAI